MSEAESFPYPVAIGYLIDTNIWSYAMQERAATVRAMESGEIAGKLLVSVVTIGEILCGINPMPGGNRRRELEARQEAAMKRWNPRIIAVGQREAIEYAMIFAELRRLGRPVPVNDL